MKTVLVTRPLIQSQSLAQALKERGFKTVIFPTLLIVPTLESVGTLAHPTEESEFFVGWAKERQRRAHHSADIAIVVSPSTAERANDYSPLPNTILALGKGTAQALEKVGTNVTDFANPANSETLLKHPLLQNITDKKILIFCGENGKTLLQDTLRARGAMVQVIYTHQSLMPEYNEAELHWQACDIDITISTSLASLKNLRTMLGDYHRLDVLQKPLVVISKGMQEVAPLWGFSNDILLAKSASNESIIRTLL